MALAYRAGTPYSFSGGSWLAGKWQGVGVGETNRQREAQTKQNKTLTGETSFHYTIECEQGGGERESTLTKVYYEKKKEAGRQMRLNKEPDKGLSQRSVRPSMGVAGSRDKAARG